MNTRTKWLRRKPIGALAAVGALVIGLSACGGSSSGSNAGTGTSTTASGGPGGFQLTAEQRSCVEGKGVTVPQRGGQPPSGGSPPQGPPSGGAPGGQDFQKLLQAFQQCGVNLPNRPQGGGNFNPASARKQISQYVDCVRKNGYDLPAPNTSGNGPVFDSSKVNQNDPKFKAASAKCQNLLPQGGPPQ
jgi:hypothetical protein